MSSTPGVIFRQEIWQRVKFLSVGERRAAVVLVTLMSLAVVYWVWFGLNVRNGDGDDFISVIAAQSILEHGYQQFPSGYLYERGHVAHYLVAGSIGVFGLNGFSIMLPSLLLGLGSLFLVYRIARDILSRPVLGLAAAALLLVLAYMTWYATGPRMYMAFQFFTLVAVYSAWRGYVRGTSVFKVVTVLAVAIALLTHEAAVILAVALPAAVLVVLKLRGEHWRSIFSISNVASVLILGLLAFLVVTVDPPGAMPAIAGHGGTTPDRVGLNLSPVNWGRHVLHLERSIPYSLAFLLVAYFATFKSLRLRLDPQHSSTYLVLVFTLSMLIFGSIAKTGGTRLIFFLLPLYALLVCSGVASLVSFLAPKPGSALAVGRAGLVVLAVLMAVGVVTSVALSTLKQIPFDSVREGDEPVTDFIVQSFTLGPNFTLLAKQSYGLPCAIPRECDPDLKTEYKQLSQAIGPEDMVVSIWDFETYHYLGRLDGWMLIRQEGRDYRNLEKSPTDEYFGVPIIDTPEEWRELKESERLVWVIARPRGQGGTVDILEEEYHVYSETPLMTVFVNSLER